MNKVWVIGDTHLGHNNILKYQPNRNYRDIREHDLAIIDTINSKVRKNDTLIHLGDAAFNTQSLMLFKLLNCVHTTLVLGNHDNQEYNLYQFVFKKVVPMLERKHVLFSHIPIHDCQLAINGGRYIANVHGHMHHTKLKKPYYNANMDVARSWPILLEELMC